MLPSADMSTGVGASSHTPAQQETLGVPRHIIRHAGHEQRLEDLRRKDVLPRLKNDRPLCFLGRLFYLRLCRFY
jgi:hypothetical protein